MSLGERSKDPADGASGLHRHHRQPGPHRGGPCVPEVAVFLNVHVYGSDPHWRPERVLSNICIIFCKDWESVHNCVYSSARKPHRPSAPPPPPLKFFFFPLTKCSNICASYPWWMTSNLWYRTEENGVRQLGRISDETFYRDPMSDIWIFLLSMFMSISMSIFV